MLPMSRLGSATARRISGRLASLCCCPPMGEQPEHPAGLLEAGQRLPLALEDREHDGMKRVGVPELLARGIHREPGGDQLPMLEQPVRIVVAGGERVFGQQDPPVSPTRRADGG